MALSLEQLQKIEKQGIQGRQKKKEEMAKPTNAAPINTTVPKPIPVLNATSRRQEIMQGTDPASMSLKQAALKEQEQLAKREELKNKTFFNGFDTTTPEQKAKVQAYADLPAQEKFNYLDKRVRELQSKETLGYDEQDELNRLYNRGAELEKEIEAEKNAPLGRYGKGNIDLTNRPKYKNDDGSISTVRSMSFNEDGMEILVPTIDYDALGNPRLLSDEEAIDRYHRTGEYLGKFKTVEEANEYAEKLHREQEDMLDDKSLILSDEEYNALQKEAKKITDKGVNATPQDFDRYREIQNIVEQSEAEKKRQDILAGKHHVVDNETYQKLMSDGRFASDIDKLVDVEWNNANQDATVSPEWAETFGAKHITGGLTKDQYYDQLSKRYELTKDQLHDIALSRKAEIESGENQRYAESLENFGENHPLIGSAGSLLGTVGSAVEGPYNALVGGVTGDERYTSRMFDTTKNAPREGAKRNMDHDVTKNLYDIGMGVADMGAGALMGNAPAVLAGNTMNRTMLESLDRGIDPRRAAAYSGASGIVDYITNTIGLDKAKELASSAILADSGLDAIGERIALAGIAGYGEGGENIVQDVAQSFIDRVINGENSELNMALNQRIANGMSEEEALQEVAKEYAQQELMSFATGVGMGATMNLGQAANNYVTSGLAGKALENYANRNSLRVWDDYAKWEAEQNNVDNVNNVVYNNATGGIENGQAEDVRTGNQGNLRPEELNPAGAEVGGNVGQERTYTTEDGRTLGIRNVVNENTSKMMDAAGINNFNLRDTTGNTTEFSQQLQAAKDANVNGRMVDSKSPEDLANDRLFTDESGTCGVAIEPDGNIVGVHKHPSNRTKGAVDDMLITARENGGDRLDCYGIGLVNKYEQSGFIPVARVEWNEKFRPDDWGDNPPEEIYFMMKDNRTTEQVLQDRMNNQGHLSDLSELESLPYFTIAEYGDDAYDAAKAYRDGLLEQSSSETASSMPETEAPQIPTLNRNDYVVKTVQNKKGEERFVIKKGTDESSKYSKEFGRKQYKTQEEAEAAINNKIPQVGEIQSAVMEPGVTPENVNNVRVDLNGETDTDDTSRTMAEDTGLGDNQEPTTIEEELPSRGSFTRPGEARFMTRDAIDSSVITKEEYDNSPVLQEIAQIARHSNDQVYMAAEQEVKEHGKEWFNDVIKGKKILGADPDRADYDFNTGMIMLQGLADRMAMASTPEERARYTALRNALLTKMRAFSTNAARTLQAHKMWVNTADGAILAEEAEMSKATKQYMAKHQDESRENARIARALKLNGYDGSMDVEKVPKTHEEIRQEVINTIDREFSSVRDRFDDNAIDYLTALAEDKSIPIWQIRDELEHFLNHGEFYTIDESTDVTLEKSNKLAKAFDMAVEGKETTKAERPEDGYYKTREKVLNTLNENYASVRDQFNDNDVDFIVTMLMEKLPTWQIADEIRHKLEHGSWYTIDESIPVKAQQSRELSSILKKVGANNEAKVEKPDTGYPEKSHQTIVEEVTNTLNSDEMASLGLNTPVDIEFIATMLEEGVSKKVIADEIAYRLETGEWYTLEEGLEPLREQNARLRNAINQLNSEQSGVEKEPISLDRQIERVRHTIENNKEKLKGNYTDEDYRYLATLLQNNATTSEIKALLDNKSRFGNFGLKQETQEKVYRLGRWMDNLNPESEKYAKAQLEMFRLIVNDSNIHGDWFDKFESWRYLAMLGNPKTMIRNVLGNYAFNAVTSVSNGVAAAIESGVDKHHFKKTGEHIDRTKALYNPLSKSNRAFLSAASDDFNLFRYASGAGDKFKDIKSGLDKERSAFHSKQMQAIEDLVGKGIEDTNAVRRKYATSLVGYMKANGLTEADLKASREYDELRRLSRNYELSSSEKAKMESLKETHEKVEKGRDYALKQAEYATFHEDNMISDWLSSITHDSKAAKVFVGGLVPFKRTPLNILRSGLEYSPIGILNSGYLSLKHIKENSPRNAGKYADVYRNLAGKEVKRTEINDVIDSWAKTFTGSGLVAIGYALASKGILTVSNKDEKRQDELEGIQNYALKINLNGKNHSYTLDWAVPAAMPMLMGAEIQKVLEDNAQSTEGMSGADIMNIINTTLNPLFETSMLEGVQDTLEGAARGMKSYDNDIEGALGGFISSLGVNLATSYLTQGIPTLSGQFARAIDDTRRSTETTSDDVVLGGIERTLRKTANKIPGLSMLNKPYLNAKGEEQKNLLGYNKGEHGKNALKFAGNLLYQMASPGYYASGERTAADQLSWDAYNGTDSEGNPIKDKEVFASAAYEPKINGRKLTPEESYEYKKAYGEAVDTVKTALANEDWFNDMSATERNAMIKSIDSFGEEVGKKAAVPEYETTNKMYAEFSKLSAGDSEGKLKTGAQNVVDYLRNEAYKSDVKEAMGTTSDWASKIYDENDPDRMTKYNEYREIAESKNLDLTETDFLTYEQKGKDTLEKVLNYKVHAKDVGIDSDNKQFIKLVDSKVPDADIKTAYDAIKSTIAGKDELGRDKVLPFDETTYGIYKKDGQTGLNRYAKFKQANVSYDLYKQAKKEIPGLSENKYIRTFHELDGHSDDPKAEADGQISQKELLYYFNENGLDADEVDEMWAAYGKVSGKDAWTMIPVLKKNKQNQYYWGTENPNK